LDVVGSAWRGSVYGKKRSSRENEFSFFTSSLFMSVLIGLAAALPQVVSSDRQPTLVEPVAHGEPTLAEPVAHGLSMDSLAGRLWSRVILYTISGPLVKPKKGSKVSGLRFQVGRSRGDGMSSGKAGWSILPFPAGHIWRVFGGSE
jgi:hypothetical protein